MKSLKVLALAVVLPGMMSAALYGAMNDDDHYRVAVERDVRVDIDEILAEVDAELAGLDAELGAEIAADVAAEVEAGAASRSCEHTRTEVARLDADEVRSLRVTSGSGALVVTGESGVDEIVVRSRMCASSERLLGELRTSLADGGDEAVVTTDYPNGRIGWGSHYARIDMEIELPLGMPAGIDDGSGEIVVRGTGETRIEDGSGAIEVAGISGALVIRDGSGEISVRDIEGDVDVVDGSGELLVADVTGTVTLTDGSGPVELRGIGRDVVVRADGSGSIDVVDVGGDLTVRADGSGELTHSGVAGTVRIPRNKR